MQYRIVLDLQVAWPRLRSQDGATGRTGQAQPEAPPAATHEGCLGRCGPLSAARTGSRAAAAAPTRSLSRRRALLIEENLALKIPLFTTQAVQDQLERDTRYQR